MISELHIDDDYRISEFIAHVNGAGDEAAARDLFRKSFNRLRSQLLIYPDSRARPSVVFESAATTARELAASCLPLGMAVAMHLYPLCALQCVPVPFMSTARLQRSMLLRAIRNHSLIVANAGSERVQGADEPVIATQTPDGIRIDGTYEYMSLASVADIVFFKAPLTDGDCTVLCAADLRTHSVRIGSWKFFGSMRLSDTSSVTFSNHRVPQGRYVLAQNDNGLQCISDYQRCWFHLFLAEVYLARLDRLHRVWGLTRSAEHIVSVNEVARLREYSVRLLDDFSSYADIGPLTKTTSALKLRVSMLTQSAMAALRSLEDRMPANVQQLRADADELSYIKSQPTSDTKILQSLGVG